MNKIYIIKRFGLVDYEPTYYDGGDYWSQDLDGACIFTKVENAFVRLNELIEKGGVGITYRVMEIDATEKCVELATKLSTNFVQEYEELEHVTIIQEWFETDDTKTGWDTLGWTYENGMALNLEDEARAVGYTDYDKFGHPVKGYL